MNAIKNNESTYDFWNTDLQDIEQDIFGKSAADAEQFAIDNRVPISGSVMAHKLDSVNNNYVKRPNLFKELWIWFKG